MVGSRDSLLIWRKAMFTVASPALALLVLACQVPHEPTSTGSKTPPTSTDISGMYALSASTDSISAPAPGFSYSLLVRNSGTAAETVEYTGCWGFLELYGSGSRTRLVFDLADQHPGCPLFDTNVSLQPGQTAELKSSIPYGSLHAAGVPAGHYYASIRVAPNGVEMRVDAGELDVP